MANADEQSAIEDTEIDWVAGQIEPQDYNRLGLRLGLEQPRLDQIKQDKVTDIRGAIRYVLTIWKNDQLPSSCRSSLAKALNEIGKAELSQSIMTSKTDLNTSKDGPKARCKLHLDRMASIYCIQCNDFFCSECHLESHNGHQFQSARSAEAERRKIINEAFNKIPKIEKELMECSRLFSSSPYFESRKRFVDDIENQINSHFSNLISEISKHKDTALEQVKLLKSLYDKGLDGVFMMLVTYLKDSKGHLSHVLLSGENLQEEKENRQRLAHLERLEKSLQDEGVLHNIDGLRVAFVPNQGATFGRVQDVSGWQKDRENYSLPQDKMRNLNSLVKLHDGRIAVGYTNGGVDIIDLETNSSTRILDDTEVCFMDQLPDDNLVICRGPSRDMKIYSLDGTMVPTEFQTEANDFLVSIRVSARGTIIRGDCKERKVYEFNSTGGVTIRAPLKTTLAPWLLLPMPSGDVAYTHSQFGIQDAVRVLTPEGEDRPLIEGSPVHCPFSTHDENGNIYVGMVSHNERMSITKYSKKGEKMESIVDSMEVNSQLPSWHTWIQVVSLTPNRLAVADQEQIYFFRRRPSLAELKALMD